MARFGTYWLTAAAALGSTVGCNWEHGAATATTAASAEVDASTLQEVAAGDADAAEDSAATPDADIAPAVDATPADVALPCPATCTDGNSCTDDWCDPAKGACVHANNANPCEDGDGCTVGDACADGKCGTGKAMVCEDGNACSDDACKGGACVFLANAVTCSDGNACTQGDACAGLGCKAGKAVDCDDKNACTQDSCDQANGCQTKAAPDGTTCNDADAVTEGEVCVSGLCQPPPVDMGVFDVFPAGGGGSGGGTGFAATAALAMAVDPGTVAIVGEAQAMTNTVAGTQAWLQVLTKAGKAKSASPKVWPEKEAMAWRCIATDGAGGWFVGGWFGGDTADKRAVVARVTSNGDVAWRTEPDAAKRTQVFGCAVLTDGTIVSTGTINDGLTTQQPAAWLLGPQGGLVIRRDYGFASSGGLLARPVPLPDGGFVAVGRLGLDASSRRALVLRADKYGKQLWSRTLGEFADSSFLGLAPVTEKGTGTVFVVAGRTVDSPLFARLGGDGQLLATLKPEVPDGIGVAIDLAVAGDGRIYAGGKLGTGGLAGLLVTDTAMIAQGSTLHGSGSWFAVAAEKKGGWLAGQIGATAKVARIDDWGHVSLNNAGLCATKVAAQCTDGLPCTKDWCDAAAGCGNKGLVPAGTACDDGKPCTTALTCQNATCAPQPGKESAALFSKTYPATGGEGGASQAIAYAGGYILGGTGVNSAVTGYDAWLLRTDLAGNVVWQKTFATASYDNVAGLVAASGGIAATGKTGANGNLPQGISLLVVDYETGDVKVQTSFDGGKQCNGHAIVEPADGGYLIAAESTGQAIDGRLIRTDATGKVKWDKLYGGGKADYAYDAVAVADGFVVAGRVESKGYGDGDLWLFKVDAVGAVVWEGTFGDQGFQTASVNSLSRLGDGLVVAGQRCAKPQGQPNSCKGWLIATDSSGAPIWTTTFDPPPGGVVDAVRVTSVSDGGLGVAVGAHSKYEFGKSVADQFTVYRLDGLGNTLWQLPFKAAPAMWPASIIAAADGFTIAGAAPAAGKPGLTAMLVRVDAFGNKSCADSGQCADAGMQACTDGNPCTLDKCVPATGKCDWPSVADGSPCEDDDACGLGGLCATGVCAAGQSLGTATLNSKGSFDRFHGLLALPSGELAMATAEYGPNGTRTAAFRHQTAHGKVTKSEYTDGNNFDCGFWALGREPGGEFVAAGHANGTPNAVPVVRFSALGEQLSADESLTTSTAMAASSVAVRQDGKVFVAGLEEDKPDSWNWWITEVVAGKPKLPKSTFSTGGQSQVLAAPVVRAWSDGILLAGTARVAEKHTPRLLRFDGNGSQNGLPPKDYTELPDARCHDAAVMPDNAVVLIGDLTTAGYYQSWVRKVKANGDTEWAYVLPGPKPRAANRVVFGDGALWIAGFYLDSKAIRRAHLTKIAPDGTLLWEREVPDFGPVTGLAHVPGFGVALLHRNPVADNTTGDNGPLQLARLDPWGNPTCTACAGLTPFDCDDANPKTLDLCDPAKGCVHLPQ